MTANLRCTFEDIEAFLPEVKEFLMTVRTLDEVNVEVYRRARIGPGTVVDDCMFLQYRDGFRLVTYAEEDISLTRREAIDYANHFIRASRDNRRNNLIQVTTKKCGRPAIMIEFSRDEAPANAIENGNYHPIEFPRRNLIPANAITNGNRNTLHRNTEFIGANFLRLNNRPAANNISKNYVYLQSELRNGKAPRAYHLRGLRNWFAAGHSTNPFSRANLTQKNMRRVRP